MIVTKSLCNGHHGKGYIESNLEFYNNTACHDSRFVVIHANISIVINGMSCIIIMLKAQGFVEARVS